MSKLFSTVLILCIAGSIFNTAGHITVLYVENLWWTIGLQSISLILITTSIILTIVGLIRGKL